MGNMLYSGFYAYKYGSLMWKSEKNHFKLLSFDYIILGLRILIF